MKPRITLITLGVDDLERALGFYRDGLGLKTDGIVGAQFEHGAVASRTPTCIYGRSRGTRNGSSPRRDSGKPIP